MPKIRVVFDIDNVLAACDSINDQTNLYFLRKGAIIIASNASHYVFPGITQLIRKLYSDENVELSFFSSGPKERNIEFVRNLLTHCLGEDKYKQLEPTLIILSKEDCSVNTKENSINLSRTCGMYHGNNIKDLSKIAPNLQHTIFIEDDPSYVKFGQQFNLLRSENVRAKDFEKLPLKYDEEDEFKTCNNAFYLAGRLLTLIETMTADPSKTVQDLLFPIQFTPKPRELMKYTMNRLATTLKKGLTPRRSKWNNGDFIWNNLI